MRTQRVVSNYPRQDVLKLSIPSTKIAPIPTQLPSFPVSQMANGSEWLANPNVWLDSVSIALRANRDFRTCCLGSLLPYSTETGREGSLIPGLTTVGIGRPKYRSSFMTPDSPFWKAGNSYRL